MKRSKKHQDLIDDYRDIKSKHLEKLATKMLKEDNKFQKLKKFKNKGKFLDKF